MKRCLPRIKFRLASGPLGRNTGSGKGIVDFTQELAQIIDIYFASVTERDHAWPSTK